MSVIIKAFLFFGLIAAIVAAAAIVFELDSPRMKKSDTITIMRGENVLQIASDLKSEGYIESKLLFLLYAAKTGNLKNLKAGEYDLGGLGYYAIIDKLFRGEAVAKSITIVPGWNLRDIAGYLEAEGAAGTDDFMAVAEGKTLRPEFDFLSVLGENETLEGYLYPDTYELPEKPTAEAAARLMLENFDNKLNPEMRARIKKQGKDISQIMTMASILEKEVKTLEDKKIVSGILWKRLEARMPLQVDSTLLYFKASAKPGVFDKSVDSPYNTYKYTGLPAGPICNPGIESIEAAIEPVATQYWYYLSAKDGATIFSKTYADHLTNIAKYLN